MTKLCHEFVEIFEKMNNNSSFHKMLLSVEKYKNNICIGSKNQGWVKNTWLGFRYCITATDL